ncbi:MAG: hypothetical protein HY908_35660 [Myxococcales bacterium]|nr:hypothetical protein [Myxococcales bacterium]
MATKKIAPAPSTSRGTATRPAFKKAKDAQAAARAGHTGAALAALLAFARNGDAAASASVAELLAFQGEWDEVMVHVQPLIAKPDAVYAGNVVQGMLGLLWRAADETHRWEDAAKILRGLPKSVAAFVTILSGSLKPYLAAKGKGTTPRVRDAHLTPQQLQAGYARNAAAARAKNDAKGLFLAATNAAPLFDDEAIAAFPAARPQLGFDQTLGVCRAFVRKGRVDDAWQALAPKLREWTCVEDAQVAPVELLYDPDLRRMMTPERCATVLATARGG